MDQKLDALKFAVAGGIWLGGAFFISTLLALLNVPGFMPFAMLLESMYGFYGYSISATGAVVGAFWGFLEGFVQLGIFALIYNLLIRKKPNQF